MIRPATPAMFARPASRLARWPLVLMLAIGLLISLMHCAGCGLAFAGDQMSPIAATTDSGSTTDAPDQQLPAHAGHCLSHVAQQSIAVITLPADLATQALMPAEPTLPRSLAGLPPFKPPRA